MEPGDIMLQRRVWYLSNIHAAIFIGTAKRKRNISMMIPSNEMGKIQGRGSD
jgi:hypothetical protein